MKILLGVLLGLSVLLNIYLWSAFSATVRAAIDLQIENDRLKGI